MPTINDLEYGYDAAGMEQYLNEIKAEYLDRAKDAVNDIQDITNVCQNEWEGRARDNFIANLTSDAQHVGEQFDALYVVLVQEINSLQAAMANKDEELIQVD